MKAYLGADWSATKLVCATATGEADVRGLCGSTRTLAAVRDLIARVRHRHPGATVHAVIEAGAPGWAMMLHEAGAVVHVVDPRQARSFARSFSPSGAKDDPRDAAVLAELGRSRSHALAVWAPPSDAHAAVHALASEHESLTKQVVGRQQRLRSFLREDFPMLDAEMGDLKARWVRRLVTVIPTVWHLRKLSRDEFLAQMAGSCGRKARIEALYDNLKDVEAPWQTKQAAVTKARAIRRIVAHLDLLRAQLREVTNELDALLDELGMGSTLRSVKGISTQMASRLVHFAFAYAPGHRDAAAIMMGAAPIFMGSGSTSDGRAKGRAIMRRSAPGGARATSYLLGRLASQHIDWARAMYADGRMRGQAPAHAYRRVARSLLRILTAMIRTGEPYDDARYVASLRAKGVPWALAMAA